MAVFTRLAMILCLVFSISCGSTSADIENAQHQLDNGNYANAIAILEKALVDDPGNVEATVLLASANFALGFLGDNG
jgi:Tfp pilus assembly protein PilF